MLFKEKDTFSLQLGLPLWKCPHIFNEVFCSFPISWTPREESPRQALNVGISPKTAPSSQSLPVGNKAPDLPCGCCLFPCKGPWHVGCASDGPLKPESNGHRMCVTIFHNFYFASSLGSVFSVGWISFSETQTRKSGYKMPLLVSNVKVVTQKRCCTGSSEGSQAPAAFHVIAGWFCYGLVWKGNSCLDLKPPWLLHFTSQLEREYLKRQVAGGVGEAFLILKINT